MKVLVTGATGPFGRAVSRRLIANGHDVVAMARRAPARGLEGATFRAGDIQDARAVRAAMEGCDAVVHLAWVVAPLKSEAETEAINLGGTRNVIDGMTLTGCRRMVFSSSVLAYGAVPGHPPMLKEDDERRPDRAHFYAAHKKAAEDLILAEVPSCAIVRSGIIAGRDVDNTIFRGFTTPVLPVPDPERVQQFVHTDDVARFTASAVEQDMTGPVNVTGDGTLTMREIAALMGRPIVTVPERVLQAAIAAAWKAGVSELQPVEMGALLYMPIVDTTLMRERWGFTPTWTSRAALMDMARAAHGRVSLGKKTIRLPWRVPPGSESVLGRISAALLKRTYSDEVARVCADLDEVLSDAPPRGADEAFAAHRGLCGDLSAHAALLADIGDQQGYPRHVVVRAVEASARGAADADT